MVPGTERSWQGQQAKGVQIMVPYTHEYVNEYELRSRYAEAVQRIANDELTRPHRHRYVVASLRAVKGRLAGRNRQAQPRPSSAAGRPALPGATGLTGEK